MKHLKTRNQLNEASENLNISDVSDSSLIVRVKHIIEYLQKNFSPDDVVLLEHDGWMIGEYGDNPENELDVIKNRGIFTKFGDSMFIEN